MNKKKLEKIMSEERKLEESLISDEEIYLKYFIAARMSDSQATSEEASKEAMQMILEHRKLFPKKLDKK